jgi:hypothetical protein
MTRMRCGVSPAKGLITRYALPRSSDAVFPSFRMHIARYGYFRRGLPDPFLDLPAAPANPMCFEPVYFSFIGRYFTRLSIQSTFERVKGLVHGLQLVRSSAKQKSSQGRLRDPRSRRPGRAGHLDQAALLARSEIHIPLRGNQGPLCSSVRACAEFGQGRRRS